jgi:alkanesulfonate monooxygenase SsuD/methylene tetrahydromethanopterin reductase-like flavin-dependent oxidoreductase (luciferase family)
VQAELPIWIGGGGEKRTLRIAAQWADGWNVPFVSPEDFSHKRDVLGAHCTDVGRDLREIRCTVNVGLALDDDALVRQFGAMAQYVRPGVLIGSGQALVDGIGRYVEAGADQVNIAMRAPWELDGLEALGAVLAEF